MSSARARPPPAPTARRGWPIRRRRRQVITDPADPAFESTIPAARSAIRRQVLDGLDDVAEPGHLLHDCFQLTQQTGQRLENR